MNTCNSFGCLSPVVQIVIVVAALIGGIAVVVFWLALMGNAPWQK